MGFPSPAADFTEARISLDSMLVSHPSATYYMRAAETNYRAGIMSGALLLIDSALTPCDGSLLVCAIEGEFRIKRYRTHPRPHLENLADGRCEELPVDRENTSDALAVFGVITYIINDARYGEFDDYPLK